MWLIVSVFKIVFTLIFLNRTTLQVILFLVWYFGLLCFFSHVVERFGEFFVVQWWFCVLLSYVIHRKGKGFRLCAPVVFLPLWRKFIFFISTLVPHYIFNLEGWVRWFYNQNYRSGYSRNLFDEVFLLFQQPSPTASFWSRLFVYFRSWNFHVFERCLTTYTPSSYL